jgi:hypothetical protein
MLAPGSRLSFVLDIAELAGSLARADSLAASCGSELGVTGATSEAALDSEAGAESGSWVSLMLATYARAPWSRQAQVRAAAHQTRPDRTALVRDLASDRTQLLEMSFQKSSGSLWTCVKLESGIT